MKFKDILEMGTYQRFQYSLYYRNVAKEYEEVMLPSLQEDYKEALDDYIAALRDSNNPDLVKVMGEDVINEWTAHCNARVDNLAAFVHETIHDIQSLNSKADFLEKTVRTELQASGVYKLGSDDLANFFK